MKPSSHDREAEAGPGNAALRGAVARPFLWILCGALLVAVGFVWLSLRRPEPPTFAPSALHEDPAGSRLVGPTTFTVDASDPDRWRFFSFARGTLVDAPGPFEWDLAFRRFQVIANGGEGFAGMGGIRDLGPAALAEVWELPTAGYEGTRIERADSVNAAVDRWYDYSFFSHLLMPKPRVYAVRTGDGRYAALEFVSYYCPGARPGCVTFRYRYQGGGGPRLASAPPASP